MSASVDVLFNMGVKGTKEMNADLAASANHWKAIAQAVVDVANQIKEAIYQAQKYSQAVRFNTTDMAAFNNETKGLIDTMASYVQANKLQQAGIRLTGDEFAALGKKASLFAKATGGDATAEFEKLTQAVIRGSSRALIPYGIILKENTDKAVTQRQAIEAVTEAVKDQSVALDTLEEKVYSLNNTIGTLQDQLVAPAWDNFTTWAVETIPVVKELADTATGFSWALNTLSNDFTTTEGHFAKWATSLEGLATGFAGVALEMYRFLPGFDRFLKLIGANNIPWNKYYEEKLKANIRGKIDQVNKQAAADHSAAEIEKAALAAQLEEFGGSAGMAGVDMGFSVEEAEAARKEYEKKKGGGGRKGRKETATTAFDDGLGGTDVLDLLDFSTPAEDAAAAKAQMMDTMSAQTQERWMSAQEAQMLTSEQYRQEELDAEAAKYEALNGFEKQLYDNKKAWAEASAADQIAFGAASLSTIGGFLGQAAALQDKSGKKGFETAKNLNIAQVAMETPAAAISAYKSLAGIPYLGPVLGAAAAATVTGFGFAQMAKIKKQKFKGGGSVDSSSVPSVSAGSSLGANNYGSGSQSGSTTLVSNIILDGNVIHRSMLRSNADAAQRGEESFQAAS